MDRQLADRIGKLADRLDNLIAAEKLPLPPQLAKDARTGAMTTLRNDLRALYVETTGENPWD